MHFIDRQNIDVPYLFGFVPNSLQLREKDLCARVAATQCSSVQTDRSERSEANHLLEVGLDQLLNVHDV